MKEKIIIIGNGAAGNYALEEILNQPTEFDITVITTESAPAYFRPMLSEYVSVSEIPKRFYIHEQAWYDSHGINVLYQTEVKSLNTVKQLVLQIGRAHV